MLRRLLVPALAVVAGACAGRTTAPPAAPAPQPAAEQPLPAQARQRPLPYPVVPLIDYRRAVQHGTRTLAGEPGPRYWTQWVNYTIETRVDPKAKQLQGSEDVEYHNRSPDTLRELWVNLIQNFHAPGVQRGEPAEITGGMKLQRVVVAGQELDETARGAGYQVEGTLMRIVPPQPVAPGQVVHLSFDWSFKLPKAGASGRMGYDDDNLLFLGYFYPQMAVYDDVIGWHRDAFMGTAEFYADFGNYDLSVEAPEGWIVNATGTLDNADDVLQPRILQRLRRAERSDSVVHVVTAADFGNATQQEPGGRLTWHFSADSVHDVAFSVTDESNWDAARTPVGDRDGDGRTDYARVDAVWRESAPLWKDAARFAQNAITHHSHFTGLSYPWPHATAVEGAGIIGGGMEYPMMTVIGAYNGRPSSALYSVVAHELAHMWIPMTASNNERRYAWMDEGTTTFNENAARADFYPESHPFQDEQRSYITEALTGHEEPIMRWSDYHYSSAAYGVASYSKPGSLLYALEGVLGDSVFTEAYHAFFQRWAFKHPYPWDLFETFEDVSGQDLSWFVRSWYYESTFQGLWVLDQAIADVQPGDSGTVITVQDNGWVPMPVHLTVTRAGGDTLHLQIPVQHWLDGNTTGTVTVPPGAAVTRVEIDAGQYFPDVDRSNNVWTSSGG